ncbi:MAG: GNAT family N-acetyltransferase [Candidatus Zixiibacteriota bacterium]|jgi:predicted acetyltransferase
MQIRKINDDERAEFVRISRYAFGDWSDEEVKEAELEWADPRFIIGVFEDGRMAAALKCFTADQSVRGVVKRMGGVSCVVTTPPYRNRGFAREVMQAAFEDMRERGLDVSMLRPFRETFYGKLGYASTSSHMTVSIPAVALGRWLRYEPGPGWSLDVAPTRDVLDEVQAFWRDEVMPRHHGMVRITEASAGEWGFWTKDKLVARAVQDGKTRGLIRYKKTAFGAEGKLDAAEFFWTDDASRELLLHYLARHRDQVAEVKLRLPYGINFQSWLEDVPRRIDAEVFHLPWMVRLMDITSALTGLPAAEAGEIKFAVADDQCPWNARAYRLWCDGETLQVKPHEDEPALSLHIRGISALAYGALDTAELARRGWLSGASEAEAALLDTWFPPLVLYNPVDF